MGHAPLSCRGSARCSAVEVRAATRTTAVVSTSDLHVSDGVVTGEGAGFTGFSAYSLSFTL